MRTASAAVLAILLAGCGASSSADSATGGGGSPSTRRGDGSTGPVAQEKKPAEKVVEAKIEDIGKAYRENEIAADKAWKGRRVRVTVKPDSVVRGGKSGLPVILARAGFQDGEGPDLGIAFEKGREGEAATVEKGKPVTVEATVTGVGSTDGIRFLKFEDARLAK